MSSEELADRFHLLLRVRARDLAPPAGFVVQKGSAGAPPGVCRSVATVCPSWGPHVEPGERKDAHRKAKPLSMRRPLCMLTLIRVSCAIDFF